MMQALDWVTLIQPASVADGGLEGACNPGMVVTGAFVVTRQVIDCKEQNSVCNHVTTETTKTGEISPSHAHEEADHLPGGEWSDEGRADLLTDGQTIQRPALHYRLHDSRNGAGSIIGAPGDTLADLLADLRQRYGQRLDLESVREAFEERAAIMEFDAGMGRAEAEQVAAADLRMQARG